MIKAGPSIEILIIFTIEEIFPTSSPIIKPVAVTCPKAWTVEPINKPACSLFSIGKKFINNGKKNIQNIPKIFITATEIAISVFFEFSNFDTPIIAAAPQIAFPNPINKELSLDNPKNLPINKDIIIVNTIINKINRNVW